MPGCGHWLHVLGVTAPFQNMAMELFLVFSQSVHTGTLFGNAQASQRQPRADEVGAGQFIHLDWVDSSPLRAGQVTHLVGSVVLHSRQVVAETSHSFTHCVPTNW